MSNPCIAFTFARMCEGRSPSAHTIRPIKDFVVTIIISLRDKYSEIYAKILKRVRI